MKLPILRYPDPLLARKCLPVEEISPGILSLVGDLVETMYESEGVGLAAPQVGRPVRIVCLDPSGPKDRNDLMVIINPEIVEREGNTESEEGCLSVVGAKFKVVRSKRVKVQGLDRNGKVVEYDLSDYPACIAQHEIDHLDGVLIVDRISRLKRSLYDKKVKKWQKQGQDE